LTGNDLMNAYKRIITPVGRKNAGVPQNEQDNSGKSNIYNNIGSDNNIFFFTF
jgi:hypothetical protein